MPTEPESDDLAWLDYQLSPRGMPARRRCLGPLCRGQRTFNSEHCGERMCRRCKEHLTGLYGAFETDGSGPLPASHGRNTGRP